MSFRIAIVGSGVMGRTLAKALRYRGDEVALLSPRPVEVPAIWIDCDAVTGRGLRTGLAGVDAVVYTAAGRGGDDVQRVGRLGAEQVARGVLRAGVRRMVLVGPAGNSETTGGAAHLEAHEDGVAACRLQVPDLRVVRLPTVFGVDDHLVWSWIQRAKNGRAFRARHRNLELRPLWASPPSAFAASLGFRRVHLSLSKMDTPITSFNGGKGQEEAPEGVGGGQGKMDTQITNFNGGKGQKKAPKGGGTRENGHPNHQF